MLLEEIVGKIHSFESFGTVDGPGVRFVVFLQGCPMRCLYCHNPDTWQSNAGKEMSAQEVFSQIKKYKNYIAKGGVTISGGEPLLQIDFVIELLRLVKQAGFHTAVDTSGIMFQKENRTLLHKYDQLLEVCDLFLLDIKHIQNEKHQALTGQSNQNVKDFAVYLSEKQKPVWIRHVLMSYTNNRSDLKKTRAFIETLKNVEKIEVLPYHTMGIVKYEKLGYPYPLKEEAAPSKEDVLKAKQILEGYDAQ